MGFLQRRNAPAPTTGRVPPMGSGRRLRSALDLADCVASADSIIRTYRTPRYKFLPPFDYPGWSWIGPEIECPKIVICFDDSRDKFLLATFRHLDQGTEIGLFPLGSGDERLSSLPITGHWKQVDPSLSSVGTVPEGMITLRPPTFPESMFPEILETAGFPPSAENIAVIGEQFGLMSLIKACQFLASEDPRAEASFRESHRYAGQPYSTYCESIFADLARGHPGMLPYIQGFPTRFRALILDITPPEGFWSKVRR